MKRNVSTVCATSSCATADGLPVLADSSRASRSAFSATRSATRCSTSERSLGVSAAHAGAAATAAATAASMSSAVPSATDAMARSELGSITSMQEPDPPGRNAAVDEVLARRQIGSLQRALGVRRTEAVSVVVGVDIVQLLRESGDAAGRGLAERGERRAGAADREAHRRHGRLDRGDEGLVHDRADERVDPPPRPPGRREVARPHRVVDGDELGGHDVRRSRHDPGRPLGKGREQQAVPADERRDDVAVVVDQLADWAMSIVVFLM